VTGPVASATTFALVNLAGLAAFSLPFIYARPPAEGETVARTSDAPWLLALLVPLLLAAALSETATGRLDAKAIALLGVLAGTAALMRIPLSIGGANLIFFLPIMAGFIFGVRFGFLVGALAMAASAAITGGIGPWLPFQMWGVAWVGAGAGVLRPLAGRLRGLWPGVVMLAIYGYLAGFFYGGLINLYFWPVTPLGPEIGWDPSLTLGATFDNYRRFYLLTSLPYDAFRGIGNALAILLLGRPVGEMLRRHRRRFTVEVGRTQASSEFSRRTYSPAPSP
jgi:energy-coupling factor transport system substrate-specific component